LISSVGVAISSDDCSVSRGRDLCEIQRVLRREEKLRGNNTEGAGRKKGTRFKNGLKAKYIILGGGACQIQVWNKLSGSAQLNECLGY
jgi:hypothetical protein